MSFPSGFIYLPKPWLASGVMWIILSALLPVPSVSGADHSPSLAELRELSIEDLLNVEVTSVTLKEALQFDSHFKQTGGKGLGAEVAQPTSFIFVLPDMH